MLGRVSSSSSNLANTWSNLGRYPEAESLRVDVVRAMMQRVLGGEHPDKRTAAGNPANMHRNLGKYTKAEQLNFTRCGSGCLGAEHLGTLETASHLGGVQLLLGKHAEAEALLNDSHGPGHDITQVTALGKHQQAEAAPPSCLSTQQVYRFIGVWLWSIAVVCSSVLEIRHTPAMFRSNTLCCVCERVYTLFPTHTPRGF